MKRRLLVRAVYALLICFFCMSSIQKAYAEENKKIDDRVKLEEALNFVSKKYKVYFTYDKSVVESIAVDAPDENSSFEKTMNLLLTGTNLKYKVFDDLFVVIYKTDSEGLKSLRMMVEKFSNIIKEETESSRQQKRDLRRFENLKLSIVPGKVPITGKITDAKGEPISGASIVVKASSVGTTTNSEGNFTISANPGDVLVISGVGFLPIEITVTSETQLTVQLTPKNMDLEEIVVVGLGNRQKKISVVGAISTVSSKELKQSPVANLTNALAGRLPGLITTQTSNKPGDGANLYIRGISTLGGNQAPLIVIDGLPRGANDLAQVDANEVESISILKDASSTSLYGIQGANGVVVITTKRGSASVRPSISFTASAATQQPIRLPKFMSGYDIALLQNERSTSPTWTAADLEAYKTGSNPANYPYVNWYDYLLKKNAPMQQYNINFSGGSEFAKYFVSGSFINQGALFKHEGENDYGAKSKFTRYNFRSNIDLKINNNLNLQVDIAGRLEDRSGPGNPGGNSVFGVAPNGFDGVFNAIARRTPIQINIFNPNGSINHGTSKSALVGNEENPYGALVKSGYYSDFTNNMYGTFSANQKLNFITKGLSAQVMFTFQSENYRHNQQLQNYDSYQYLENPTTQAVTYKQVRTKSPLSGSYWSSASRNNYLDFRINYNRVFGKHTVAAQILANRTYAVANNDIIPFAYQGISSRATYSYDNRYFGEFNLGYNGSENFPKGKRYGIFPSFSAGWVISNEKFFPLDNQFISFLKLRGSYGLVGNDKYSGKRFLFQSEYSGGGRYGFGTDNNVFPQGTTYYESQIGNPNVSWEKAAKMNVGLEATMFKSFAKLTVDYFREVRSDILLPLGTVSLAVGVGSNLAPANVGKVLNRGFEAQLDLNKRINKVTLFSSLQVTYARNKVLNNAQAPPTFAYQNLVGYEIGYSLGLKTSGLFNSLEEVASSPLINKNTIPGNIKFQDMNKDGIIDANDRVPIQTQNIPRYVFGASFGASYMGFDCSILLNGATGGQSYFSVAGDRSLWTQRWMEGTNQNPNAILPTGKKQENNGGEIANDFWSIKTDYLKLRNAEIGYTLPRNLVKRLKINTVRFYVNGQNLAVWDSLLLKELDPESVGSSNFLTYPSQRVINVGLNIKF